MDSGYFSSKDSGNLQIYGSQALLKELQFLQYEIARQAELASSQSLQKVQSSAEQALRLIDSFMITAQAEYGQGQLELSPCALGSVMHTVVSEAKLINMQRVTTRVGVNVPVITNSRALVALLSSALVFIHDIAKTEVVIRSFSTRAGEVGVGVFAQDFNLSQSDLNSALRLAGRSTMPFPNHSHRSGYGVVLSAQLASLLGGELVVKRMGALSGFATMLPISKQLALV